MAVNGTYTPFDLFEVDDDTVILSYGIIVKVVTIDAATAFAWLKRNKDNRHLKRANLARLCAALRAAKWDHLNGETIIFGADGGLLDGQHRLQAVVDTGIAITSLVVFGIDASKRGTIDTGSARQLADYLSMHGYQSTTHLSAAAALHYAWQQGVIRRGLSSSIAFPSFEAGLEYIQEHPELNDAIKQVAKFPRFLRPAEIGALGAAFSLHDRELHHCWLHTMINGTVYNAAPIFLPLRERLLRDVIEKRDEKQGVQGRRLKREYEGFVFSIKAFNAARQKRATLRFQWGEDEPIPALV